MDDEHKLAFNQLIARLLVLESAVDAIFTAASRVPAVRDAIAGVFETQVAAMQEGTAGKHDLAARDMLRTSYQRFAEALHPEEEEGPGTAPT